MKKLLTVFLVVCLLLSCLGAVAIAEEKPKILFSVMWTNATDDVVQLFEDNIMTPMKEAFPDYDIDYEVFSDRQSMMVQVAGGSGPDFFELDGVTDAIEYAKAGRILDLKPYAEKYGWQDKTYEWAYDSALYNGTIYGIPNSFEGMVIYYNEKVFEENGWEKPTTVAELEELCKVMQEKGIVPFAFGNSNYQGAVDWLYSSFLSCYCGPEVMKQVLTGEAKFTDELPVAAMQLLVDWWKAGYFQECMSQAISNDDMLAEFAAGNAAMMIDGTWAIGDLNNVYTDCDYSIDLIPELREGVGRVLPLATGGVYCINANCKYPDETAEVINWLLYGSMERHVKSIETASYQAYPVKAFSTELFSENAIPSVVNMYDVLSRGQESGNVGYCSWTFYDADARVYMNENTDALFLDMLSVEDYMAKVQEYTDIGLESGTAPIVP